MKKIRIAIVGFGNIGKGVLSAISRNPDMKLTTIFTRRPQIVFNQLRQTKGVGNVAVKGLEDCSRIDSADVAILCGGSKEDLPVQGPLFARLSNTVDSYDTHAEIPRYFRRIDRIAKRAGKVAIICGGWDPGLFSMMRVLFDTVLSKGHIFTFWGKGVSQGHSEAARKVDGVLDARQYTIPIPKAVRMVRSGKTPKFTARQMHQRLVYVVLKAGADPEKVKRQIVNMPHYFKPYDTQVLFISAQEMAEKHSKYPHGGFVFGSGSTAIGNKNILEFSCRLKSNPEFTANILVACARAAFRLQKKGKKGAFTMSDVPLALYSPFSDDELRTRFI